MKQRNEWCKVVVSNQMLCHFSNPSFVRHPMYYLLSSKWVYVLAIEKFNKYEEYIPALDK